MDGKPAGVAGYYLVDGVKMVFSDIAAPLPKTLVWRMAKRFMASVRPPAVCVTNNGRFLERLGWQPAGQSEDGDIYRWLN